MAKKHFKSDIAAALSSFLVTEIPLSFLFCKYISVSIGLISTTFTFFMRNKVEHSIELKEIQSNINSFLEKNHNSTECIKEADNLKGHFTSLQKYSSKQICDKQLSIATKYKEYIEAQNGIHFTQSLLSILPGTIYSEIYNYLKEENNDSFFS